MNTFTIYRHLLWKEFRFLSPLILLSVGIALLLQFIQFTSKKEIHSSDIELYLAEAIPVLVAMICIGVSIGYERDNRSWNWFSSIPVSWKHVLSSKAFAAITLVVISTLVLQFSEYALLAWMNKTDHQSVSFSTRVIFPAFVTGCFLLVLFSSVLLTRQTLSGIVLALIVLSTCLVLLPAYPFGLLSLISLAIAGIGLWLFRWRWTTGQFADVIQSIQDRCTFKTSSTARSIRTASAITMSRPSKTGAIFWQVSRQCLPLMILAIGVCLVISFVTARNPSIRNSALLGISMDLSALIIGIGTLYTDVRQEQFRFISDRGVSVLGGLLTRLTLAAMALLCFILVSKLLGIQLFVIGLLACLSVAGIAIANSSVIALVMVVLSALIYGVATSYLTETFMQGSAQVEPYSWRTLFDWNPTVHICVFAILMLVSAIWLWNIRYRRLSRWLVVRYVLFAPVAFVIASLAAIPTIVYRTKYVDPQVLFGQAAAPVTFYQVDGQKPYGSFSKKVTLISNLYASGKLGEYRFSHSRDLLEASANQLNESREGTQSQSDLYFASLQDRVQRIRLVDAPPPTDAITLLNIYMREDRLVGQQSIALAEKAAAEVAEIVFIAVFLEQADLASSTMDKYLDLIELQEPAYTDNSVSPLSMIKPDEWNKYFSAKQRSRILKLSNQSVQQLIDRHRSLTQWKYHQIEQQSDWPWRRAFFQRILLLGYQRELKILTSGPSDEIESSQFANELQLITAYNEMLESIKNNIRSIQE